MVPYFFVDDFFKLVRDDFERNESSSISLLASKVMILEGCRDSNEVDSSTLIPPSSPQQQKQAKQPFDEEAGNGVSSPIIGPSSGTSNTLLSFAGSFVFFFFFPFFSLFSFFSFFLLLPSGNKDSGISFEASE